MVALRHISKGKSRKLIRGFTLVDALVAAMMTLGISALAIPTFISTTVVHRSVERANIARDAARAVVENIRDVGVNNITDGSYSLTQFGNVDSLTNLANATGTITITTPSTSIRKVAIRVQWTSGLRQGRLRTYNTVTLLTPGGVSP